MTEAATEPDAQPDAAETAVEGPPPLPGAAAPSRLGAVGRWLARWGIGCALVVLLAAAIVASLLAGEPQTLPAIALGSPALLYAERAAAFFGLGLVALMVVVRGFARDGQLPSEVTTEGLRYEVREVKDASAEALAALEDAVRDLRERLDVVEALEEVD